MEKHGEGLKKVLIHYNIKYTSIMKKGKRYPQLGHALNKWSA